MRRIATFIMFCTLCACSRRELTDGNAQMESALLEVEADWSRSGITPSKDVEAEDYVNRLSLRFFPTDGSPAFDRYLETDVTHGWIDLPIGTYSVVAFNESIDDPYWDGVVQFLNKDNFEEFAAQIEQDNNDYDFYTTQPGETLAAEPYKLASWSLARLEITPNMANVSKARSRTDRLSVNETKMTSALTNIELRRLTCYTTITATVENLSSAQRIMTTFEGLSNRVYMASGETHESPVTHVFTLNNPSWSDAEQRHGSVSGRRLCFDVMPSTEQHHMEMDVIFVDGARYNPDTPLHFDIPVGETRYADDDIAAQVNFSLPEVKGGIQMDPWGDDESILIE